MTVQRTNDNVVTVRISGVTSSCVTHVRIADTGGICGSDTWEQVWDEIEAHAVARADDTGEEQDIETAQWDDDGNVIGWTRAGIRVQANA